VSSVAGQSEAGVVSVVLPPPETVMGEQPLRATRRRRAVELIMGISWSRAAEMRRGDTNFPSSHLSPNSG
jgi:hypothetical protein